MEAFLYKISDLETMKVLCLLSSPSRFHSFIVAHFNQNHDQIDLLCCVRLVSVLVGIALLNRSASTFCGEVVLAGYPNGIQRYNYYCDTIFQRLNAVVILSMTQL